MFFQLFWAWSFYNNNNNDNNYHNNNYYYYHYTLGCAELGASAVPQLEGVLATGSWHQAIDPAQLLQPLILE